MSDMSELHDYENRPKKKNPFRSRPIPKSRIEWAIRSTMSIRAAAQHLGVAYNTFKKYAKNKQNSKVLMKQLGNVVA